MGDESNFFDTMALYERLVATERHKDALATLDIAIGICPPGIVLRHLRDTRSDLLQAMPGRGFLWRLRPRPIRE